jgi:hypothetical protein
VLVGWAIAFGTHSPALSLAALGVLVLGWIAWSMVKRKTASIVDCPTAPESGTRDVRSAAETPPGSRNAVPTRTEKILARCPVEPLPRGDLHEHAVGFRGDDGQTAHRK